MLDLEKPLHNPFSFHAQAGIAILTLALAAGAESVRLPPLVPAASPSDILLAQAMPEKPNTSVAGGDSAAPAMGATRRHRAVSASGEDVTERRDHYKSMQSTGFGLIMAGVGTGVGGLILMITSLSDMKTTTDQYGYQTTEEPGAGFFIGYLSLALACPTFLTTGIIINRVGNHKRARYQRMIDEGETRLDVGPNSMRLTYSF